MSNNSPARILITLDSDLNHSHPFRVLAQTTWEAEAGPTSMMRGKVRDGVSCRSARSALTYANGINHGLSLAGVRSLPIVWDALLRPADGGAEGTTYATPHLVRS